MKTQFENNLINSIHAEIAHKMLIEGNKAIEEAKRKIEKQLNEVVSSIALEFFKHIELETLRDRLIITIKIQND